MNVYERIIELGYHVIPNPYRLTIYKHGNFIALLYRFEKNQNWISSFNTGITIFNVKDFLKRKEEDAINRRRT